MVGQHKDRAVIRRCIAPPPLPIRVAPWPANRPEHVAAHDRCPHAVQHLRDHLSIDRMIFGVAEVPVVQGFTADAERVLLTLTGPRDVAVGGYRHRKIGSAHLYTDSGSSRYSSGARRAATMRAGTCARRSSATRHSLALVDFRVFVEPQQGASYSDQLAVAQAAESLGFSAFFRSDHYLAMSGDGRPGPTDSWVTLGGIARETSSIRLGTLVTSATFRYPGPLAISVAQVDEMSDGRVEFGHRHRLVRGRTPGLRDSRFRRCASDSPGSPSSSS